MGATCGRRAAKRSPFGDKWGKPARQPQRFADRSVAATTAEERLARSESRARGGEAAEAARRRGGEAARRRGGEAARRRGGEAARRRGGEAARRAVDARWRARQ